MIYIFYTYLYHILGAVAYLNSRYGPGSGPVFLSDMECLGSEDTLINCSRKAFGDISSNCKTHLNDASVLCKTGKIIHLYTSIDAFSYN